MAFHLPPILKFELLQASACLAFSKTAVDMLVVTWCGLTPASLGAKLRFSVLRRDVLSRPVCGCSDESWWTFPYWSGSSALVCGGWRGWLVYGQGGQAAAPWCELLASCIMIINIVVK